MTDPEPKFSLSDLIAAERAIDAEAGADARIWAAIERRLVDGPPPPDLGAGAASSLLKWAAGLALAGGVVGGAALGLAGGDPAGGGEATRSVRAPAGEEPALASDPGAGDEADGRTTTAAVATATDEGALTTATSTSGQVEEDMSSGAGASTTAAAPQEPPPRPRRPPRSPRSETRGGSGDGDPGAGAGDPAAQGLDAELRLIARIRGALRRGEPDRALALIADHRRLFADGALVQERWAHEVEALCAVGRRSEADAKAAEFLKRWPDSTHSAAVQAGCGD